MAMKVATFNGCKVYNLSAGKTMPNWLPESKRRALAKDEDYRRRLELIQEFENTVASQCIKMTNDGEHIVVTGVYPPVVKCFTVSDLALKFQRGLTCDVIAFETLSDDFGKLVFLQSDRTLNFHAPYGTHYSIRVPKFGRDLVYNWESCDLFVSTSSDEIYRLNLEAGQFREPFKLAHANTTGCNKMHINPTHRLLGCGLDGGVCEFWDMRSRTCVSKLVVDTNSDVNVSALKFDVQDGLTLGVGTSNGNCILYDIRSSKPLYVKEHQYGLPVIDISYHTHSHTQSQRHIISTDKKIVKIWERDAPQQGRILTNIETPADINDILIVEDKSVGGPTRSTGMIMCAGEQTRIMNYFVPQLGPAPKWCSFLESITEELEETTQSSVYEDYKFLTRAEVEELGAAALIGTPMLKGYMHGFFIEMKLYNKLRAVSKPFEYEEYRLKKIREKIEEKRQSRITAVKRLPRVNKELAEKLLNQAEATAKKKKKGSSSSDAGDQPQQDVSSLMDSRFADLFKREEFQVDEDAEEYKLANPTRTGTGRKKYAEDDEDDLRDIYTPVGDQEEDEDGADDEDDVDYDAYDLDADEYDEDGEDGEVGGDDGDDNELIDTHLSKSSNKKRKQQWQRSEDEDEDDEGQIAKASRMANLLADRIKAKRNNASKQNNKNNNSKKMKKGPQMYELADGVDDGAAASAQHDKKLLKAKKFAAKVATSVPMASRVGHGGGRGNNNRGERRGPMRREMSFMPKGSGKKK